MSGRDDRILAACSGDRDSAELVADMLKPRITYSISHAFGCNNCQTETVDDAFCDGCGALMEHRALVVTRKGTWTC